MYNSGFRSNKKTPDGVGTVASQSAFVQKSDPSPTILSWSIQGSDDRALDPAGGQTVVVAGAGFTSGMTVTVGTSAIGAVTIVNSSQATFTAPAKTAGNYTLTMANANGQAAILVPGLAYSTIVTWTTPAGSIGTTVETTAFTESVVATADSAITYALASGSLPTGATLNANGVITGTAATTASPTTYSFSVTATDLELQDSTQSFTITVAPDTVTWVSPANNTSYALTGNQAMSNVTLSATAASGSGITYSANALPTGVSLTGNVIYGTPTVAETVSTLLTATANTTTRSSTETITWTVSVGDIYWPYVSMLLNGSTPTTTFINDASLNNNALTIVGDTRPNNFIPYAGGYYSNYFDGTGDYLSLASNAAFGFGTGNFTMECWVNLSSFSSGPSLIDLRNGTANAVAPLLYVFTDGVVTYYVSGAARITGATLALNTWYHLAVVRSSGVTTLYVNGAVSGTPYTDTNNYITNAPVFGKYSDSAAGYVTGYISNIRIVKGQALYTSTFTPSTTPLTTTSQSATAANVSLLTCQSSSLVDNSVNNFAITKNGDTTVSSAYPFPTPTTSSYNTQYSTYFDGTGDYLTVPNNAAFALPSDYTIEMWYYPTDLSASSNFFSLGNESAGQNGMTIYWKSTASAISLYVNGTSIITSSIATPVGSWYHIALVRIGSGTNNTTLYINGVSAGTVTNTTSYTGVAGNGVSVGAAYSGSYAAMKSGSISNVRIVKGVGVYTGAFTPPTSPLTATQSAGANIAAITAGQTSLLACQNSTLIDNSTNAFTITSNGDARPVALSPFTMTTSTNTVTSLGATYFDGTGDYLSLASNAAMAAGSSNFTLEMWVFVTATPGVGGTQLYDNRPASTNGAYLLLYMASDKTVRLWVSSADRITSSALSLNTWYHIAVVRNSGTTTMYINGVSAGTWADSTTYLQNGTYIGASYSGGASIANYLTGYMADIRFINGTALYTANFLPPQAPLTPVANTQLLTCQYNGGANNNGFVDQSSFNNIITRNGNTTQGTFSPYSQTGWSNYFDGTGDYLSTSANAAFALAADYTIEAWVYRTDSGTQRAIVDLRGGAYVNVLFYMNSANKLVAFNSTTSWIVSTNVIPLNAWTHVAISRSGTSVNLFINGTIDGTATNSDVNVSSGPPYIGRQFGSTVNDWLGYISNVRVVKGQALYTTNFTPSTTPLTASANTSLLTCQSNRLIDTSPNNFAITKNGDTTVQAYSPFGGVTSVPTSYSVYFDGTGDYATASTTVPITTGAFTIEFWMYVPASALGTRRNLVGNYIWSTGDNGGWNVFFKNDNKLYLAASTGVWNAVTDIIVSTDVIPSGSWTHVAIVRNSSNQINMYFNGVVSATPVTYSASLNQGTMAVPAFRIGYALADSTVYDQFIGQISNARIVQGTAVYTSAFTPPTSPLTAIANTVVLTCQSPTFIDNGPNNITFTTNGDCRPLTVNPFGMTNTTGVSYTPLINSGSMYFDGTGDYLSFATSYLPTVAGVAFTLEMWVYPTRALASGNSLISSGNMELNLDSANAGQIRFDLPTGVTNVANSGASRVTLNAWNHIVLTRSAANAYTIYLNGVNVGTGSSATAITTLTTFGYNASTPFMGYVSDLRSTIGVQLYTANFYPGAAPATPTQTIGTTTYASKLLLNGTSGGIIDYHGSNDLETVGNTQLAPQDPYGGSYYSNYFDNTTSGYLSLNPGVSLSGDFTIELWVYATSLSKTYTEFLTGSNASFELLFNGTTLALWTPRLTHQTAVTLNTWHHIALTRSGTTIYLYLDGVRSTSSATSSTTFLVDWIGSYGSSISYTLPGYISNLRIVSGSVLYSGDTISVPTSPLTAISGTQLLTCQSNSVKDNSTNSSNILTNQGGVSVKTFNPFQQNTGKSLYFDGTADRVLTEPSPLNSLGSGDFTIEGWLYCSTLPTNARVLSQGTYTTGEYLWIMYSTGGADFTEAATARLTFPSGSFTAGSWIYFAIVRSGSGSNNLKAYVNGVSVASATSTYNYSATTSTYIGSNPNTANQDFNGYIKDLRITKGVARYTTTFTPPTTPDQTK